ncbi:TonB-dependent receptor [Sphingosinicella microcystinivorans]|uniref:TonB-dependent receptor n=1 Tax=Sphingosinicella microcystinivorans TaxID=335406 RepID=UPI0022F380B6|nr:TonB-dependent receptor [Sphingosinicella microcystinivorans]WBX86191.1 TonB-dependent receptor [Sphingosinicella microcystinivorans]
MAKTFIIPACAISVTALITAQAAWAQTENDQNDDAQSYVGEIVVTAQKREQRLQDVPIAITALTGDTVASMGVETTDDLSVAVPAVSWQRSYNGSPFIRGVGKPIVTAGNESSVGIFVDGVLQVSPLMTNFALNNVERIEVLKGPQGTLFGRNSNGGVISITTRDPSHDPAIEASVGYANYDTFDAKFYGSTGLTDTLAANISLAYYNQADGWGTNVTTGDDTYREKTADARAKLQWQPSDDTSLTFIGEYHYMRSQSNAYSPMPGTLAQDGSTSAGFYNLTGDFETFVRTRVAAGSLIARHDMGWAELVSISAYTRVRTIWPYDSDGSPSFLLQGPIWERADSFTQELQLVSPDTGPVKWVAGLYYMFFDARFDPIALYGENVGGAKVEVFGATKANSYAAFGEATWEFLPDTHLTLGGRMTFDHRSVNGHVDVNDAPGDIGYQSKNFREPTWRVTLDHSFSPDFMIYGTASTGYNSGQFNTGNAFAPAVDPEKLTAFEAGFKSQFLNRRVQFNASAFTYDYRDLQVTIIEDAVTLQTNAAKARIKGFEAETNIVPAPGLILNAALAYTDAKYTDYASAQFYEALPGGGYTTTVGDATGNRLASAPKWSLSASARYEIATPIGSFTPAITYSHRSKYYWDSQNSVVEPAHDVVNASLTYTSSDERWSLRIWGKNLTDEKMHAWTIQRPELFGSTPAAPKTYGATVSVKM